MRHRITSFRLLKPSGPCDPRLECESSGLCDQVLREIFFRTILVRLRRDLAAVFEDPRDLRPSRQDKLPPPRRQHETPAAERHLLEQRIGRGKLAPHPRARRCRRPRTVAIAGADGERPRRRARYFQRYAAAAGIAAQGHCIPEPRLPARIAPVASAIWPVLPAARRRRGRRRRGRRRSRSGRRRWRLAGRDARRQRQQRRHRQELAHLITAPSPSRRAGCAPSSSRRSRSLRAAPCHS